MALVNLERNCGNGVLVENVHVVCPACSLMLGALVLLVNALWVADRSCRELLDTAKMEFPHDRSRARIVGNVSRRCWIRLAGA